MKLFVHPLCLYSLVTALNLMADPALVLPVITLIYFELPRMHFHSFLECVIT